MSKIVLRDLNPGGRKVLRRGHDTFALTLNFKWGVKLFAVGKTGVTLWFVGVRLSKGYAVRSELRLNREMGGE